MDASLSSFDQSNENLVYTFCYKWSVEVFDLMINEQSLIKFYCYALVNSIMVIRKLFTIILLSGITVSTALTQNVDFRVFSHSGSVNVDNGDNLSSAIDLGDTLRAGTIISIDNNSYIGLVHWTGQSLELMTPGKYLVDTLSLIINNQKLLAKRHLNYIWGEIYDDLLNLEYTQSNGNEVTGNGDDKIKVYATVPGKLNPIYQKEVSIHWTTVSSMELKFSIDLKDLYDNTIFSEQVSQPIFTLNIEDERLRANEVFNNTNVISISINGDLEGESISKRFGVTPLKSKDYETVSVEKQFFEDMLNPLTRLDLLAIAKYYEEKGLLLDALSVHLKLASENSDIQVFQMLCESYIQRTNNRISNRGTVDLSGID